MNGDFKAFLSKLQEHRQNLFSELDFIYVTDTSDHSQYYYIFFQTHLCYRCSKR